MLGKPNYNKVDASLGLNLVILYIAITMQIAVNKRESDRNLESDTSKLKHQSRMELRLLNLNRRLLLIM